MEWYGYNLKSRFRSSKNVWGQYSLEVRDNNQIDYCFILPNELRQLLIKPYGFLFTNEDLLIRYIKGVNSRIISVGDVVTVTLFKHGIKPFIAFVDGKTKRVIKISSDSYSITLLNEPGLIRLSAMSKIKELLSSNSHNVVFVEGEEDLLVIPVILYSNNGDIIVYGQPNAGIVMIRNNALIKEYVEDLFKRFKVKKC
ncbi:DUF359 domain-containing protein [Sulfolobus sp. SCGC AB-777_G05]|jgi:uncharacterized protein (UPF0218 family)|nr:DUF359 domain-containing protein [Sulfolobus sp. SCGC AB-777_G05]